MPLLHNYQKPEHPIRGSIAPTDRFRAAVQDAKVGPGKDIPHISAPIINKYISDLHLLGLLPEQKGRRPVEGRRPSV